MNTKNKTYTKTNRPSGNKATTQKQTLPKETKQAVSEKLLKMLTRTASTLNRTWTMLVFLLVFALGFLIYGNTMSHEYALDDDMVYKLNNSVKKGLEGIPEIVRTTNMYGFNQQNYGAYRPFTQTVFALEFALFGINPHAQHVMHVLLFALTVALLFLLMKRLFQDKPLWISLAITLIYLAHPIHTEVVANIKSLDEILSFLFGFVLTFLALFRYLDTKKIFWLIVSIFLFLLGLMSKENIATLLPVIPLTLYFFTDKKPKNILFISLGYLLPMAIFGLLRWSFIASYEGKIAFLDNFVLQIPTFVGKYGTILFVLLQYLRLCIFPFPQSCDYSFSQTHEYSLFSLLPIVAALLYVGMLVAAVLLFKRKNLLSWCILFFLCALSVYSHIIIGVAATIAERFLFLPSLPFIVALVLLMETLSRKMGSTKGSLQVAWVPLLIIFFVFSIKTMSRNTVWKNNDTLFMNDIKNAPNSSRLNKSIGDIYINKGKDEKDALTKKQHLQTALEYLQKAYTIYPDYTDNLLDLGTAWYYLAEYDTCWKYWKRFATVDPTSQVRIKQNLDFMKSGFYLQGQDLSRQGKKSDAIAAYTKSLQFDSIFAPSWFNMGLVYADLKNFDASRNCMTRALQLDSTNADYWYNYGGLLFTIRDLANARSAFQRTLKLKPDYGDAQKGLNAIKSY